MTKLTVACVQTNSKRDPADNVAEISPMIREAAARGADFITTPEIVGMFEPKRSLALEKAQPEESHEVLAAFRALADELSCWLLIGSISIKLAGDKLSNRSFLVGPDGAIVARYSKIHMFDVQVGDGATYRDRTPMSPAPRRCWRPPLGPLGMTICYDIRFPALYRTLAQAGAGMITAPAPSPRSPARPIGMSCNGRGRSRMAPSSFRRRRPAPTPRAGKPMAIP